MQLNWRDRPVPTVQRFFVINHIWLTADPIPDEIGVKWCVLTHHLHVIALRVLRIQSGVSAYRSLTRRSLLMCGYEAGGLHGWKSKSQLHVFGFNF